MIEMNIETTSCDRADNGWCPVEELDGYPSVWAVYEVRVSL